MMLKSSSEDLPLCLYQNKPILIPPSSPTPNHSLYLSNLDDQNFLRFSIKYLYLFKKSLCLDLLKFSLSSVLVDYYPLAGRLRRTSSENDHKLQIDCNGEGAIFVEAFMDITANDFLELSWKPNRSWRKLLFRVEANSFVDVPPLVVQVTNLRCGGMILCIGINHSVCDGIGTSQFLRAWAQKTAKPKLDQFTQPFHTRHVLNPRNPSDVKFAHHEYSKTTHESHADINQFLQSQPLVPSSLTFTTSHILKLKRTLVPSLKCTTFEALAAYTWRSWVKSLDLSPSYVKLLFSVNVRNKMNPEIPQGYYGNAFVLACAEAHVNDLVDSNLCHGVKLVQEAKSRINDEYVRSMIDFLEDPSVKTDLSRSLVISQWSKLGLEELDFGEGKPMHMGPLTSDIYCLFLPVVDDISAVRVLVSMPEDVVHKFEYYMKKDFEDEECYVNNNNNGYEYDHHRVNNHDINGHANINIGHHGDN